MLFFTELWERLAYYGMRGLLILYLIDTTTGGFGWTEERGEIFTILGGQADFFLMFVGLCQLAGTLLGLLIPTLRRLMGDQTAPSPAPGG